MHDKTSALHLVTPPRPRPARVDSATLDAIRFINAQLGEAQARAQALIAERSLLLTKALARAGCAPEDLDLVIMAPDGTLTYRQADPAPGGAAPPPVSSAIAAALAEERAERGA